MKPHDKLLNLMMTVFAKGDMDMWHKYLKEFPQGKTSGYFASTLFPNTFLSEEAKRALDIEFSLLRNKGISRARKAVYIHYARQIKIKRSEKYQYNFSYQLNRLKPLIELYARRRKTARRSEEMQRTRLRKSA